MSCISGCRNALDRLPYQDGRFLYKEPLFKEPTVRTKIFKELILRKERKLRKISILKLFITASNQELGSWFHSNAAKTCIDTFANFFHFLFAFYYQVLGKIESKIPNLDVFLCLYHFMALYVQ